MQTITLEVRAVIGQRADFIPAEQRTEVGDEWIIFNAPRPLPGHAAWTNTQLGAWFYSAVNPAGEDAARLLQRCVDLDARALAFYAEAEVYEQVERYYAENHPNLDVKVREHSLREVWPSFTRFCFQAEREVSV